jgi:peptide/nickel transport system permease protein
MNTTTLLIARRIGIAALTLLLVSVVVFSITSVLPGDAAQAALGQSATPEMIAALRAQMGLDAPAYLRYLHWLGGLLSGNPGQSLSNNTPVAQLIGLRLPKSLWLAGAAAALSVPIALSIGIVSAMHRGSYLDRGLSLVTLGMVAVPEFLVATVAVLIFAVKLHWLSALSYTPDTPGLGQFLRAYAMPVMTLSFVVVAQMARMTRAAVVDQVSRPYVEMAILKGASPARIVLRHALPNAAGPIANAIALSLSYLLGGAIIVETIFNFPGIASLMVDAVTNRDMPLLQACAMIFCCAYLALVLLADVFAIISSPKLRHR